MKWVGHALGLVSLLALQSVAAQTAGTPRPNPERLAKEISAFAEEEPERGGIVFTGDSDIRLWPKLRHDFPNLPVVNRGVNGALANDLIAYGDTLVFRHRPKVLVTRTGGDDIDVGLTVQEAFDAYTKFLLLVHERLPKTEVILNSTQIAIKRQQLIPQVLELNRLLANWANDKKWIHYVDCTSYLLNAEGRPLRMFFRDDLLHLSTFCYAKWREILEPEVREWWERIKDSESLNAYGRSHLIGGPQPNVNLPTMVKAEPGRVTLFADFEHPEEKGVVLYLVNRTHDVVPLSWQDGDIFIKLERQLPSGAWERAQMHVDATCGESYGGTQLPAGMYFRVRGYRPLEGEPAKIRYVCYGRQDMVSNMGDGIFSPDDVDAARMDRMSLGDVPRSIAEYVDSEFSVRDKSLSAHVAALRMLSLLGESPLVRRMTKRWIGELEEEDPSREQQQALAVAREILKKPWGERLETSLLLKQCLAAVKSAGKEAPPQFGALEKEPELVWEVIHELGELESRFGASQRVRKADPSLWKEALQLAAQKLPSASTEEGFGMAQLLGVEPLADEFVPDEAFESLLKCEPYSGGRMAADALSRRGKWERMADLAFNLKPENQISVLVGLTHLPTYQQGKGAEGLRQVDQVAGLKEKAFWAHVLKTQPVKAAAALNFGIPYWGNPFARNDFSDLRSFWQKECERSDHIGKNFDLGAQGMEYRAAAEFVASWRKKEDVPLLEALLRYRGYESLGGYKHEFRIRYAAADALKQMGELIPKDVAFDEEVKVGAGKAK